MWCSAICVCVCVCVCMCVVCGMCVCMCVRVFVCVCRCVCMCVGICGCVTLSVVTEQVHRCLMMLSVLVSCVAFIAVFVANKDAPTPGLIDLCNRVRTGHPDCTSVHCENAYCHHLPYIPLPHTYFHTHTHTHSHHPQPKALVHFVVGWAVMLLQTINVSLNVWLNMPLNSVLTPLAYSGHLQMCTRNPKV